MKNSHEKILHLGIDIGSTTTKIAVINPQSNEIIYSDYRRHQANQLQSVKDIVSDCAHILKGHNIRCCFTGSGAKMPADSMGFSFVQEVVANSIALQGVKAEPLDIGREEAIRLGKQYVHNDICFPAQIVIGEALAALRSWRYDHCDVAVGTGKYIGDCRLTHYGALLRKALDDAGYSHVPIITNDDVDYHNMHPGFKMNALNSAAEENTRRKHR